MGGLSHHVEPRGVDIVDVEWILSMSAIAGDAGRGRGGLGRRRGRGTQSENRLNFWNLSRELPGRHSGAPKVGARGDFPRSPTRRKLGAVNRSDLFPIEAEEPVTRQSRRRSRRDRFLPWDRGCSRIGLVSLAGGRY